MAKKLEFYCEKIERIAKQPELQSNAIKYLEELARNQELAKDSIVKLNLEDHLKDLSKHVDIIKKDPKYQEYEQLKFKEKYKIPEDRAVAMVDGQQLKTVPANDAYDAIIKLNSTLMSFSTSPPATKNTYRQQIAEQLLAMRKPEIKQAISDAFTPKAAASDTQKPAPPPRNT